jgi:hypothetical protein
MHKKNILRAIRGSSKSSRLAACGLFAALTVISLPAYSGSSAPSAVPKGDSSSAATPGRDNKSQDKAKDVVETGCLIRRDKPGEFALTTQDAKLFYVESSTVDLSAHAGHTVKITGTFAPESESERDPDKSPEAQTIIATKLEMISKACH